MSEKCSICAMSFNSSLAVSIKVLFSGLNLVSNTYQGVSHAVFNFSDKRSTVKKETLEQSLTDISLVRT